jgi:NAD(P)-dependent dehydrogenase (short-subunit alcohol dehydrogenase family)
MVIILKMGMLMTENSVAANTGGVVGPHYASSKSAMHGLLHWVAQRYAKDGIVRSSPSPCNEHVVLRPRTRRATRSRPHSS